MLALVWVILIALGIIFVCGMLYDRFSKHAWILRYEEATKKDLKNWLNTGDESLARREREEALRHEP